MFLEGKDGDLRSHQKCANTFKPCYSTDCLLNKTHPNPESDPQNSHPRFDDDDHGHSIARAKCNEEIDMYVYV